MWENFDGYRLLVMGAEPPRPGEIWSCILTKHRYRASDSDKRLLHRVLKLVNKVEGEYDKTITEMINEGSIPCGSEIAKGKGQKRHYGDNPIIYTVKMPSELRDELEGEVERLSASLNRKVSLNQLVVTLIELGHEYWDGEEVRY